MSIALITGANRGLGFATARALALNGSTVILMARDQSQADQAAATLCDEGHDVHGLALDVTSPASITTAVETVQREHGRLDMLVNNAGILPEATDGSEHEFANPKMFQATFATNVFGAVAVTDAFLPMLRQSPMGRIVNVSSTMGSLSDQADPNSPYYDTIVPAYRSSKAAPEQRHHQPGQVSGRYQRQGHLGLPRLRPDRSHSREPRAGATGR